MRKLLLLLAFVTYSFAGNPFDIKKNFFNETPAHTWKDPTSGVTYYSGPNYEYRFKDETASAAPWVQFQLPSARIGCNGLSIKGGFMALLGLKDIKLQLENAGPTFAWGVLTTIEISMPSVAAVFHRLQQWVRKIQSLLQNACSTGQMVGRWLQKSYGFGKFEGNIINKGADKILDFMDSVEDKLDEITNLSDDNNDTKKSVASDKLHKVGSGVSFLAMEFGKAIGECDKKSLNNKDKVDFDDDDVLSGRIEGCNFKGNMSESFDRSVLSYMLTRTLFGELVVTKASLTPLTELFKPDGTFDIEATKRELKSVVARSEAPYGEVEYSIYPPVIGDAREAARFLVNGKRDGSGNVVNISIPRLQSMYVKFKYSDATDDNVVGDANGSVKGSHSVFKSGTGTSIQNFEVRAIYTMRPNGTADTVSDPLVWKGLIRESKDNILKIINLALKNKLGSTQTSNLFGSVPVPHGEIDTKTPLLISGIGRYLNVLTQAAVERGGIYTVMPLIDLLSEYNAELFAEQLLSRVKRQIDAAESGPNLLTTEHTRKGFADFRKRVNLIYTIMQDQLSKMRKETISDTQKVPEIFNKLESDMNARRIGNLRGQ